MSHRAKPEPRHKGKAKRISVRSASVALRASSVLSVSQSEIRQQNQIANGVHGGIPAKPWLHRLGKDASPYPIIYARLTRLRFFI